MKKLDKLQQMLIDLYGEEYVAGLSQHHWHRSRRKKLSKSVFYWDSPYHVAESIQRAMSVPKHSSKLPKEPKAPHQKGLPLHGITNWHPKEHPSYPSYRWALFEKQNGKCIKCGFVGLRLTLDHIWERSDGGHGDLENLQLLCVNCHLSKTLFFRDSRTRKLTYEESMELNRRFLSSGIA